MRALIVEDEQHVAQNLAQLLGRVAPEMEVVAITESVTATVDWLRVHAVDVIFLDIQLSDGVSFDIFTRIELEVPVIFTTAYDEYALRAFKLNSVDYLLKPVNETDLKRSIQKLKKMYHSGAHTSVDFEMLRQMVAGTQAPNYKKRFLVYAGKKIRTIYTTDIAYFISIEKNTFLITHRGQSYPVDYTLDKLENGLDPERFFRINRKLLIQIDAIKEMHLMSRSRIQIDLEPATEETTFVSVAKTRAFRNWLEQ